MRHFEHFVICYIDRGTSSLLDIEKSDLFKIFDFCFQSCTVKSGLKCFVQTGESWRVEFH